VSDRKDMPVLARRRDRERAALPAFLHAFYTAVENLFKAVPGTARPDTNRWAAPMRKTNEEP